MQESNQVQGKASMNQHIESTDSMALRVAPLPPGQAARLAALRSYAILDTPIEAAFEDITRIAAYICESPMAVINFIGDGRHWFKSEIGLGVRETPIHTSICAHAILEQDFLEVPDTRLDERFSHNPLVTGRPYWRFYSGAILRTPEGHALGMMCVLDTRPRRLTEDQRGVLRALARQTMAQLELRRALAQAAQTNQYRGRLMAVAGHDLKQPLTEIMLVLDLLRISPPGQADLTQIAIAVAAAERLDSDLNSLAIASRLDGESGAPALESLPVDTLMNCLLETWTHAARRKGLQLQVNECDTQILTDPTMLQTMLDNLVANAIKYTDSGSVKVECRACAEGVSIEVSDTGRGIATERLGEIFEAFRQIDPASEGLGLGLSIVKRTADILGYRLHVVSSIGQGSTFGITVPMSGLIRA